MTEKSKLTICINCQYFFRKKLSKGINNFHCSHIDVILKKHLDVVTGIELFIDNNGNLSNIIYPYCKDINNDGNCKLYKEKGAWLI